MNKIIKQAFTLIELLVVIAIIGILSGLIVVSMGGMTDKASIAKSQVFSNSLRNSLLLNMVAQYNFDDIDIADYDSVTKVINNDVGNIPDSWAINEGRAYGGPILKEGSDCISGDCLSFDGVDDYVNVNHSDDFNISKTGKLTAALWFKTDVINGTAVVLKSGEWMFYPISGNTIRFLVSNGVSWNHGTAFTNLQTDKWYYVVGIADYVASTTSLNMKFYVDAKKYGDNDFVSIVNTSTGSLAIGSTWTNRFDGSIDDVRIYNSIATLSQIKEQYYTGLNKLFNSGQITKEEYLSRISNIASK